MTVLTDKQFFFVAGSVALLAGVAALRLKAIAPDLIAALKQTGTGAKNTASALANAPLQATRDPLADSSDFGTEAWAAQQYRDIQNWLGIGGSEPLKNNPYDTNRADPADQLPDFSGGVIVPYRREGF